ncbi:hypothetical protein FACS1894132_14930 [Clostridia bacterium]|nr:hypothetical protein FACS1894132_14930 [Clostridia bacterium]
MAQNKKVAKVIIVAQNKKVAKVIIVAQNKKVAKVIIMAQNKKVAKVIIVAQNKKVAKGGSVAQNKKMAQNKVNEKILNVCKVLENLYPDAKCSLDYKENYQLIIAARLSAQCTDERVNKITPALFERYKTLDDFANADIFELETYVHSCGFYHSKARDIKALCGELLKLGHIPDTIDELVKLSGIGRKTANLIMGDIHHKPAIVADTHFIRITGRLGLTENTVPAKVEKDLRAIIPPQLSSDFCHRIVLFGRDICKARKPECDRCPLRVVSVCNYFLYSNFT